MNNQVWYKSKISLKTSAILGVVLTLILLGAPNRFGILLADSSSNCTTSTQPTFNPYPTSENPGDCQDYPFLSAEVIQSNGTKSSWTDGSVQATAGEKVEVQLYIDNGAASGSAALTNMRLTTSADLSAGSSHSFSASVTASNANNSLNGSLNILTPSGTTLQVDPATGQWYQQDTSMGNLGNIVNTTTSLPNQNACFPYIRFIDVVFDVTAQTPPAPATISLSMNKTNFCVGDVADYTVTSTSNGSSLSGDELFWSSTLNGQSTGEVKDGYGQYLDSSGNWTGSANSGWTTSEIGTWTKTVMAGVNGPTASANFTVSSCSPAVPTGTITASVTTKISNECLWNGTVTYSFQNFNSVEVKVQDLNNPSFPVQTMENGVPSGPSGSKTDTINWLSPAGKYLFTLYNNDNGTLTAIATYTLDMSSYQSQCTTPPAPATISLSLNKTNFCVGDVADYTVTSTSNGSSLSGDELFWSSTLNGQSTGEVESGYGQFLDSAGNWTGSANSGWTTSEIGTWTKTVMAGVNGPTASANFTVSSCNTPKPATISLSLNKTNFCVGDVADYTVTSTSNGSSLSGDELFWSSTLNGQSTGEVESGYGQFLDSAGNWTGSANSGWTTSEIGTWTKTVMAGVNGPTASANFTVSSCNTPKPATISLSLNKTNFCVGDVADYTVTSTSNGSSLSGDELFWSSTLNGQSTGEVESGYGQFLDSAGNWTGSANSGWTTSEIGTWTKTVMAGVNGPTASANFTVSSCTPVIVPVTCSVIPSTISTGGSTTFSASNGNGSYSWSVNGGSVTSSSQQSFSSTFSNPGSYSATVTSGGTQATCSLQVNTPECTELTFNPTDSTISQTNLNPNETFQVSCDYGKQVTTINPSIGGGASCSFTGFNNTKANFDCTAPSNPGSYPVSCVLGASSANNTCAATNNIGSITVTSPIKPGQLSCSADSQSGYTLNNGSATATFTATGGSSPYSWTNGGNPSIGTGSSFSTAYTSSGSKTVTVQSSDGQTANCSTNIYQSITPQNGVINLTKGVENVTAGETSFSPSTSGKLGDTLEYQIEVSAGTSVTLNNVLVTDSYNSSQLTYVPGSLEVNGQPHASGLTSGGLSFPSVTQTPEIITYEVTINVNSGTVVNVANATASNASPAQPAQALVNVTYVQPGQPALSITKEVEDTTQNIPYSNSITAKYQDQVQFQVVVTNVGQATADSVYVSDSNPTGVQPLTNVTATVPFTGTIQQGILIGNLAQGSSVTVTYDGTVNIGGNNNGGSVVNVATVSANNAISQRASATINVLGSAPVTPTSTPPSIGNCDYDSNSCNHNTNTNTQTSSGNNSGNENNQTNINGNNNTVTNSNENCVNYSCNTITTQNTYYITSSGSVVPQNEFAQLAITKSVRDNNGGTFGNSISANYGDTVQFEVVVTNSEYGTANNVILTDNMPSGLTLVSGSVIVNGASAPDQSLYSGINLGSLSEGQQASLYYEATVESNYYGYNNVGSQNSIENTATASSQNAGSVQASAWVFVNSTGSVQGGSVDLSYSKSAFNNTQNQNATAVAAARGDSITYTLTVSNSGNTPADNFIITDDLSQVLPYSSITDDGGGSVTGNVISFPGITVPANGTVTRSFEVQVKQSLTSNQNYVMSNTYGNTVTIQINSPQVLGAFTAPTTGANTEALTFSTLLTAAFALFQKRKSIAKVIFS
jgi:uncharacterized repeat protein (TIGR01451 family)